ncbi:hypothetical protein GPB2148_364 [marine gamma proteobacterium HTCC2148]|nr:hypothetical protein GPB2148_364 [marine gamma proteobacterium HTCC2148]
MVGGFNQPIVTIDIKNNGRKPLFPGSFTDARPLLIGRRSI